MLYAYFKIYYILNSNLSYFEIASNSSVTITMPNNKMSGFLLVSIGITANAYALKYNNISTNMTNNGTSYIEATFNSTRSFTIKNTNTGSHGYGILIML